MKVYPTHWPYQELLTNEDIPCDRTTTDTKVWRLKCLNQFSLYLQSHQQLSLDLWVYCLLKRIDADLKQSITQPISGDTIEGGEEYTVEWVERGEDVTLSDIGQSHVYLYAGNDSVS